MTRWSRTPMRSHGLSHRSRAQVFCARTLSSLVQYLRRRSSSDQSPQPPGAHRQRRLLPLVFLGPTMALNRASSLSRPKSTPCAQPLRHRSRHSTLQELSTMLRLARRLSLQREQEDLAAAALARHHLPRPLASCLLLGMMRRAPRHHRLCHRHWQVTSQGAARL